MHASDTTPLPFESLPPAALREVAAVATDIDDTLTRRGRLDPDTVELLGRLAGGGLRVLLVTGRPAGIALGLAVYFPFLEGVIAENGGAFASAGGAVPLPAAGQSLEGLRERLEACSREVLETVPGVRMTGDSFCRLTDAAFDVAGFDEAARETTDRIAARHGLVTVASTIHLHLKLAGHEKGRALRDWMARQLPPLGPREVLTVGDSPNDATILDPGQFPLSVGVANAGRFVEAGQLPPPAYLTASPAADGFAELARRLLEARRSVSER